MTRTSETLPKPARDARLTALGRLALATREFPPLVTKRDELAMQAFFQIYLEDTASFPTNVVVEACRWLEINQAWFPKVAELVEACRTVGRRQQERRESVTRRLLESPPVAPESLAEFKAKIRAIAQRKVMR